MLIAVRFRSISADLWVGGTVPNANVSGKSAKVQYAVGAVSGPIQFAELGFLGFKIRRQAFSAFPVTLTDPGPLIAVFSNSLCDW